MSTAYSQHFTSWFSQCLVGGLEGSLKSSMAHGSWGLLKGNLGAASTENLGSETVVAINFEGYEVLSSIQGTYKSSINKVINFDINTNKVLKFDKEGNRINER